MHHLKQVSSHKSKVKIRTLRFRCTPGRPAMMGCNGMGMQPGFKPIHFMGTLHADDDGRFMGYGQPSVA
uniref:Sulfatase n=1 Tax=Globodera pallida TaxID=36090 RepID=A0A183BLR3_GLOPA